MRAVAGGPSTPTKALAEALAAAPDGDGEAVARRLTLPPPGEGEAPPEPTLDLERKPKNDVFDLDLRLGFTSSSTGGST